VLIAHGAGHGTWAVSTADQSRLAVL
jgi:hypothetical protein